MIWPFFSRAKISLPVPGLANPYTGLFPDGGIRPVYQNVIHCKHDIHQMVKRFRIFDKWQNSGQLNAFGVVEIRFVPLQVRICGLAPFPESRASPEVVARLALLHIVPKRFVALHAFVF